VALIDELLTVEEAAAMLDVSAGHMYNLRWSGAGPLGYRRGARLIYRRNDVESFLARERETTMKGQGR
jgi:hypothetical protein